MFWEAWLVLNFNWLACLVVLDLYVSKSKERERLRGKRGRVPVARLTGQIKRTISVFLSNDGNTNCFGSLCLYFLTLRRLERKRREGAGALVLGLAERREAKFSIYTIILFFWTGSVRVNRSLYCKTKNQTKPGFFLNILIGLIGFI